MASEKFVSRFLADLDSLEKKFPGVIAYMRDACEDNHLHAYAEAHKARASAKVDDETAKKKTALQTSIDTLKALGMPVDALEAQLQTLDKGLPSAVSAYEKAMKVRPTGKADTGKDSTLNCVTEMPFDKVSYFGVFLADNDMAKRALYKQTPEGFVLCKEPDLLKGYKVKSATAARKLAWAIVNKSLPSLCHDGVGKSIEGQEFGGSLIKKVSDDPVSWLKEHNLEIVAD